MYEYTFVYRDRQIVVGPALRWRLDRAGAAHVVLASGEVRVMGGGFLTILQRSLPCL